MLSLARKGFIWNTKSWNCSSEEDAFSNLQQSGRQTSCELNRSYFVGLALLAACQHRRHNLLGKKQQHTNSSSTERKKKTHRHREMYVVPNLSRRVGKRRRQWQKKLLMGEKEKEAREWRQAEMIESSQATTEKGRMIMLGEKLGAPLSDANQITY